MGEQRLSEEQIAELKQVRNKVFHVIIVSWSCFFDIICNPPKKIQLYFSDIWIRIIELFIH